MLHAPILAKSGPAFRRSPPMTPDTYLRLRREAAGLTRRQVAERLAKLRLRGFRSYRAAETRRAAEDCLALVDQLETPKVTARHRSTLAALAAVFPLDVAVYFQLATDPVERHPAICPSCGSSRHDDQAPAGCLCRAGDDW